MQEFDLPQDFEAIDFTSQNHLFNQTETTRFISANRSSKNSTFGLKYLIDSILEASAVLVLLLMIITISLKLLLFKRSPILIVYRRIGKNGVLFSCYKFRTMVKNGDKVLDRHLDACPEARREWNESRKLKTDPRVTYFGRSHRRNSLDEIPQLLNVIRGEMSLVGPRPITPSEIEFYGPHCAHYVAVRPGLTGLWQVSGRSETSYEQRVRCDVKYVAEQTFIGDLVVWRKLFQPFCRASC